MLQGVVLWEPDAVPHAVVDGDRDVVVEIVVLTVGLIELVCDAVYDAETVGELDNVDDIDDDGESVPEDDCDPDRELHGDAE